MTRPRLVWALFAAAFMVSTCCGQDPLMSLAGRYSAGCETAVLMALCWLAFELGQHRTEPKTLALWMTVAGALGAFYCLLQKVDADPWIWTHPTVANLAQLGHARWGAIADPSADSWGPRAMGATGNPVFSGALIALSMAWAPAWLVPFLGAGLWATGSRAAMLAAAAVIAWRLWEKQERRPFIIGLAALGLFAVLQVRRPGSDRAHVAIALAALRAWRLHPLLGWGPATGAIAYIRTQDNETMRLMSGQICKHTHNLITNVLVTQGLLGLASWGLLLVAGWRASSRVTSGALISVVVFGMFEPIPLMAYVVLALAVGMDASPINAPPRRGWSSLLPAAACLFAFLTWEMVAERYCLMGRVDIAASMCPWEFAYCEYDVAHAMQSARLHRGNPMAYFGPVDLLRKAGQFKDAEVLVRIENRMDPLKLLQ